MAWGGVLANLAAGVFLVGLRPFRTGDSVTAGGVTGTVVRIGLLATTINTPDNVHTIIGNNKILSDTIQNFSPNPHRRVDLVAQLHHTVEPEGAMQRLRERIARIPNVATDPAPQVEIPGDAFWRNVSRKPLDELNVSDATRDLRRRVLFIHPIPFVRRVIFVATPHHGSYVEHLEIR